MARRWRIGLIGFLLFTRTLNVKNVWTKPNWRKKAVRLHLIYMKSNRHLACCLGCAYLFMSASLQGLDSMPPYWLSVCCICVWEVCTCVCLCGCAFFSVSMSRFFCTLGVVPPVHAAMDACTQSCTRRRINSVAIQRRVHTKMKAVWCARMTWTSFTDPTDWHWFQKSSKTSVSQLWQHCGGNCAMRLQGRQHTDNVPPAFAVALPPCPPVHQECGHHNPCTNKKPKGTIPVYLHVRSANGHCCVSGSEQAVPMQDALFLFSFKGCVTCRISPGGAFPFPLKNLSSAVLGK